MPDPQFELAKKENAKAELSAKTIVANASSLVESPERISPEMFQKIKGHWTGVGYLAETCKGIVEKIEPIRRYGEGGSWSLVGESLLLVSGRKIPLQRENLPLAQAPVSLERVTCDQTTIFAIGRRSIGSLVVHRFLHSGRLMDTFVITLPDVAQSFPGEKWPEIWEVSPRNEQLEISLARYAYPQTANLGGIVEKSLNYTMTLPSGPKSGLDS